MTDGLAVVEPAGYSEATARPSEIGGIRVLIDTVSPGNHLDSLIDCALRGVLRASELAHTHAGRARPLIAIPLVGVGAGLFAGQRGRVVEALVRGLHNWVSQNVDEGQRPCDVALVLYQTADYAAAQWHRHVLDEKADCWPELSCELKDEADRLGNLAAAGNLSVFAGAGVSIPLGFPSWDGLLQMMAKEAGTTIQLGKDADYPAIADGLRKKLPDLNTRIAELFTTDRHALGHGLLACLRTRTMVTTNYDSCLENAARRVHEPDGPRVLARQLAEGDQPWVLKLHGDVAAPESIVLSSPDYLALQGERRALRGVVQTLMLTSHVMFVGFGFNADDFADMYAAVSSARALAQPRSTVAFGTTIALSPTATNRYPEIISVSTSTGNDTSESARQLEILLDRMVATGQVNGPLRAAYVLDRAYESSASEFDLEVRRLVEALTEATDHRLDSPVRGVVANLRRGLGLPTIS